MNKDAKYIVSFTTFGPRVENSFEMIQSLKAQQFQDFRIVMTLYKDDVKHIGPNMKMLIDSGEVELIVADKDLGSHLKYFYAMKKYPNQPIITVDDDRKYKDTALKYLVDAHEILVKNNIKAIVCNWGTRLWRTMQFVPPMTSWPLLNLGELSKQGLAEGFMGVLYPAACFSNLDKYMELIEMMPHDDDLILKAIGIKEKVPVFRSLMPVRNPEENNVQAQMAFNLHNNENTWKKRNENVAKLNPYFLEAFE